MASTANPAAPRPRVLVIGSLNADLVVRCARMPEAGETLIGRSFARTPGGKGLNQAIAAARDGAEVEMCGAVGFDETGEWLRELLADENVDDAFIIEAGETSGTALIEVDDEGRNRIVVIPAANGLLEPAHAIAAVAAQPAGSVVLASLEVPIDTVTAGIIAARERGLTTIVNPAPAADLPAELLAATDVLIPNEHEVLEVTGAATIDDAIAELLTAGVGTVIVTLGEKGVRWSGVFGTGAFPTLAVQAVDTVAAGDAFCGVTSAAIADGYAGDAALTRGLIAGAITVTRVGAAQSLPRAAEIDAVIDEVRTDLATRLGDRT